MRCGCCCFWRRFSNKIMLFTFFSIFISSPGWAITFYSSSKLCVFHFLYCKIRIRKLELVDIIPCSHIIGHVLLVLAQLPMKFPLVNPSIHKLIDTFYHPWPIYFCAMQCAAYQPILANTLAQWKKITLSLLVCLVDYFLINSFEITERTCITFERLSNKANSFQNVHHHHLRIL